MFPPAPHQKLPQHDHPPDVRVQLVKAGPSRVKFPFHLMGSPPHDFLPTATISLGVAKYSVILPFINRSSSLTNLPVHLGLFNCPKIQLKQEKQDKYLNLSFQWTILRQGS